jgi:hypothetical protein
VVRSLSLAVFLLCLQPSMALGQYAIPSELSVGLGLLRDWAPSQSSPSVVGAVAWDYRETWWTALVIEGEVGGLSEADPCQQAPDDPPGNCFDGAVLAGLRFRRAPHASSGIKPFGSALVGGYWKGSGTEEQEYLSSHMALQLGGGLEFRWAGSIQGVRASIDYRRVFADDGDRNQIRLLCSYVIGPRRFKSGT